jgi:hypothetical protein
MAQTKLDEILARFQSLQDELESELETLLEEKREYFQYTFEKGKVRFKRQIRELQRKHKKGLFKYIVGAELRHIVSIPFIYSIIFPIIFIDISVTLYQHICFRLYGIPRVKRSKYLIFDRQHLEYLNVLEKFNCLYCGYGNGVMAYVREIIARTEQYWCPIKHANKIIDAHRLTENYVDYGDASAYREKLAELRKAVASENA